MRRLLAVFAAAALAACGGGGTSGSSPPPTADRDGFVGTWQVNGMTTFVFTGDITAEPWIDSGNVTIIAGLNSDEIVFPFYECNITAKVSGNTAHLQQTVPCAVHDEINAYVWYFSFTSSNLVRTDNIILNKSSGDCTVQDNITGDSFAARFAVDDALTKVGK